MLDLGGVVVACCADALATPSITSSLGSTSIKHWTIHSFWNAGHHDAGPRRKGRQRQSLRRILSVMSEVVSLLAAYLER